MLESILSTTSTTTTTMDTQAVIIAVVVALLLGCVISITYMKTGEYSRNFARTLVVMPVLVGVVMTLVNGSLGTSVAILGAFSLVRFRSLQGSSRDLLYVFFSMTIGLATSAGYVYFAMGFTLFLCLVIVVMYLTNFAEKKTLSKELRITIPENLDYTSIFDDIFTEYTEKANMVNVKTTNMGSMYEISYHVVISDVKKEKEMIDAIRCRNGNLTVICGRVANEQEL